jgi:hypothetical protein
MRALRLLRPPAPDADPRESLLWVRRMEIASGVICLIVAGVWADGWWRWLLVGLGLLGLSPWLGARSILRRAERKPGVLVTDPDRRRVRARRTVLILVPVYVLVGGVVGYLVDGWPAAGTMGGLMGVGAALGAWWVVRRYREP